MFTPTHLRVAGFRGFHQVEEFALDQPASLVVGPNGSGKSSMLNAIEWCLFGSACTGRQTGIRERIDWLVPNQHLDAPAVTVELAAFADAAFPGPLAGGTPPADIPG